MEDEKDFTPPPATYSLMAILRDDPDYAAALKKRGDDMESDKNKLINTSNHYTEKYHQEVEEGDKTYRKLLGEGKVDPNGVNDKNMQGKYIPTKHTPILNYLFFSLRDEDVGPARTQEDIIHEFLKQFTDAGFEKSELIDLYIKGLVRTMPDGYDDAEVDFADVITDDVTITPDEMDKFIYGNLTHNEFKKLKKLKALAQSSNAEEAFLALTKCLQLCKKWNMEYDKIPCNVKKIDDSPAP